MSESSPPSRRRVPLDGIRFLGRVQFTMALLVLGAIVMTAGTVIESREGTSAARALVYRTLWFDGFLVLIALNLIVAVANRLPIQRHQWAFVLTHFSIVLLLAGAWVSRTFGFEGELSIVEGSRANRIFLDGEELRTHWRRPETAARDAGAEAVLPLPGHRLANGLLQRESGDSPEVRLLERVPHGESQWQLIASPSGGPGVEIRAQGPGLDAREWLLADDSRFQRRRLGAVELEMVRIEDPAALRERVASRPSTGAVVELEPQGGGTPVRIQVPEQIGQAIECGPDVVARVESFLLHARVGSDGLVDDPGGPVNPAVVLRLESQGRTQTRKVFAQFPDFDMGRGVGEAPLIGRARLEGTFPGDAPRLTLIAAEGGLWTQVTGGSGREAGQPLEPGRAITVGKTRITVEKLHPAAAAELHVRPSPGGTSWARIAATWRGARGETWLSKGGSATLALAGQELQLAYLQASHRLPFTIALDRFEVAYHPGSGRPASYASTVRVQPDGGEEFATVVSMNRPLDCAGFRLFQSSYQLGRGGGPSTTILSVSFDPGVPIVYSAFALIIVGVAWYLFRGGRRRAAAVVPLVEAGRTARPGSTLRRAIAGGAGQ